MKGREAPPPFAVFAIFWCMGLIVAHLFDIPILFSLSIAFFLLLTSFFKKNTVILLLVIFLFAALHYELQQTKPANHLSILLEKNDTMRQPVQGKIISEKDENHYLLDIETIRNIPVEGKAFLYYDADTLAYGDIVETIADIFPIPRNSNPAAFNYRQYLETKQIYAYAIAKTKIKILENKSSFLKRYVISVRVWIREQISEKFSQNSAFVKAILLGDKKDLGEDKHNYIKAGLSHIFAVSGLHVGIISSVFFVILHLFIKHKPTIRIILITVLLFYAAICQWRASVFRAIIMLSVYFIAKNIQRKTIPNNILALSLMIITFINPAQLFTPGLLLSFIAVFTLVNFIPKFRFITLQKEDLKSMSYMKKFLNWTALISISSLLLGVSLAPITIYFFNQFSLNGTVANIIAMPLMGIILIPLAIIIIILPFGWELYESAFQLFYEILEKWVNFSGNLPLYFEFVSISTMQVILLYFAFYLLYKICRKDKFKTNFSLLILVIITFTITNTSPNKKLRITFFDCGLGDLFLIETPYSQNIMVDTGSAKTAKKFSNSCLPYLIENKINNIDYLIITHAHEDHYGGATEVFQKLKVNNLVITDDFMERDIWTKIDSLAASEKSCKKIVLNDTLSLKFQDIICNFIHPDPHYSSSNINNMSIVFTLSYKDFSIIFTGDMEEEGEAYLLNHFPELLDVDFLKAGHHGSKTSSSEPFIKAVTPEYAVISTSLHNRFDFPHPETLDSFSFLEENLFITGKDGAILILTDGNILQINTFFSKKQIIDDSI